jgi:hypothetical protein
MGGSKHCSWRHHLLGQVKQSRWRASKRSDQGWISVMTCGAQPNQRLKLTPPGIYCRIPFVIIPVRRRSLAASR